MQSCKQQWSCVLLFYFISPVWSGLVSLREVLTQCSQLTMALLSQEEKQKRDRKAGYPLNFVRFVRLLSSYNTWVDTSTPCFALLWQFMLMFELLDVLSVQNSGALESSTFSSKLGFLFYCLGLLTGCCRPSQVPITIFHPTCFFFPQESQEERRFQ